MVNKMAGARLSQEEAKEEAIAGKRRVMEDRAS
jgi:hypothetical protein